MKRLLLFVVLALTFMFIVGVIGASAAQLEPALDDVNTTTLFTSDESRQVFDAILQSLQDAVPISPFVLFLVQFVLKPLSVAAPWPWFNQRKAPELASIVAVGFVIGGAISNTAGYANTFDSVAIMLDNLAPPLVTIVAAVGLASGEFNVLQWLGLNQSVMKSRTPSMRRPGNITIGNSEVNQAEPNANAVAAATASAMRRTDIR